MKADDLLIENGIIYTPRKVLKDAVVFVHNGRISYVGSKFQAGIPKRIKKIDAEGCIVCPGFLDLQVNGGGGVFLTEDGTYEGICTIAKAHAKFGTTSMLPTIITAETDEICNALEAVSQATVQGTCGAAVLGSHLEGPFINAKKKGIHEAKCVRPASISDFEHFYHASKGTMKVLTLAPEIEGGLDLVRHAREHGVHVSVGHSTADYRQIHDSVDAGLSLATHIFNAMEGLGSREPGTVGAILTNHKIRTGLIADGIHVHPMSMKIVVDVKGAEKVFLVTDAMPPVGTNLTSFKMYDKTIRVKEGGCYAEDGTIAGSALSMNIAVKTIHEKVGVPLNYAIAMATEVPAKAIGVSDRKGSLTVGKDADIVVCDSDMRISKVIVSGCIVNDMQ